MDIGITSRFFYGFFANGLCQNIIFLYELLEAAGYNPIFIDFCDTEDHKLIDRGAERAVLKNKNIIHYSELKENVHSFDVVLCPGIACNHDHYITYKSLNQNCKIVSIQYGNTLMTDMCDFICKEKSQGKWPKPINVQIYDETWISPHYKFQDQFLEVSNNCPVKILPYIWDDKFIIESAKSMGILKNLQYEPNQERNIAVIEPNLNITKNYLIPLNAVKHLLRTKPELIENVFFYGAEGILSENKTFVYSRIQHDEVFIKHLNKLYFDPRRPIIEIMKYENPIFLSHQHLNALNYAHLEALYFNYPLVHNSDFIQDYGYYYNQFDCIDAGKKCIEAIEKHDDCLDKNQENNKEVIWKYHPRNKKNIKETSVLIENLFTN